MHKYIDWKRITRTGNSIAEEFIIKANLDLEDAKIIRDRANKVKQHITARSLNCSRERITCKIRSLMDEYKKVQKEHPDLFPELNKESGQYRDVYCVVTIEYNNQLYSVKLKGAYFMTFADIRAFIIKKFEEEHGLIVSELQRYTTYISGGYDLQQS